MDGEVEIALIRAGIETGCHWTASRKSAIITLLRNFPDHSASVMERFNISAEEIVEWTKAEAGGRHLLMERNVPLRRR